MCIVSCYLLPVPERRTRNHGNMAKNFDDEDCGESPWSWHVDANWGCGAYPEVRAENYCSNKFQMEKTYLQDPSFFDPNSMSGSKESLVLKIITR